MMTRREMEAGLVVAAAVAMVATPGGTAQTAPLALPTPHTDGGMPRPPAPWTGCCHVGPFPPHGATGARQPR